MSVRVYCKRAAQPAKGDSLLNTKTFHCKRGKTLAVDAHARQPWDNGPEIRCNLVKYGNGPKRAHAQSLNSKQIQVALLQERNASKVSKEERWFQMDRR